MTTEQALAALEEVSHAVGRNSDDSINIRRYQQGDPEFCVSIGGYSGAQLNKHHLKALLFLIEEAEKNEPKD